MDFMPILSKVLEAVLSVVLPVLAVALVSAIVALAKKLWAQAKQASPEITDVLEQAAKFAVKAAEQAGAAELIEDKKQYAIEIAEKWLSVKNLNIDVDLIDAAIEKAVLESFNDVDLLDAAIGKAVLESFNVDGKKNVADSK